MDAFTGTDGRTAGRSHLRRRSVGIAFIAVATFSWAVGAITSTSAAAVQADPVRAAGSAAPSADLIASPGYGSGSGHDHEPRSTDSHQPNPTHTHKPKPTHTHKPKPTHTPSVTPSHSPSRTPSETPTTTPTSSPSVSPTTVSSSPIASETVAPTEVGTATEAGGLGSGGLGSGGGTAVLGVKAGAPGTLANTGPDELGLRASVGLALLGAGIVLLGWAELPGYWRRGRTGSHR